nr:hypothetical protein [Tanacetum cinerariifolium]
VFTRIAEASFGDVYRLSRRGDLTSHPNALSAHSIDSVIKIIPVGVIPGTTSPGDPRAEASDLEGPDPSLPADVATEVKILQRLSGVPG